MKIESLKGFKFSFPSKTTSKSQNFQDFMFEKIKEVDQLQKKALQNLEDFAAGKKEDFLELTLSMSQADLSFKFLVRVRNKIIEAYQEIMRMQI